MQQTATDNFTCKQQHQTMEDTLVSPQPGICSQTAQ